MLSADLRTARRPAFYGKRAGKVIEASVGSRWLQATYSMAVDSQRARPMPMPAPTTVVSIAWV